MAPFYLLSFLKGWQPSNRKRFDKQVVCQLICFPEVLRWVWHEANKGAAIWISLSGSPRTAQISYHHSILSLRAVEKSFGPITCHIYSESSLIKLSIIGKKWLLRASEEGKRQFPSSEALLIWPLKVFFSTSLFPSSLWPQVHKRNFLKRWSKFTTSPRTFVLSLSSLWFLFLPAFHGLVSSFIQISAEKHLFQGFYLTIPCRIEASHPVSMMLF